MKRCWIWSAAVIAWASTLPAAEPASKPSAEFRKSMRQLLETADERGPGAPNLAQQRFQTARTLSTDPRPTQYAYGVVLQRLFKAKDAQAQFFEAAKTATGVYPPAYEAWVTTLLSTQKWSLAADALMAYADTLVDQPAAWTDPKDRTTSLEWLGRAVSAAILVTPQGVEVQRFTGVDRQLRERMPENLRADYIRGFDDAIQIHEQVSKAAEETVRDAKEAQEKDREKDQARIKEQQEKSKTDRESLKQTAEEWKKSLDMKLADFAKQLGVMERDWLTQDQRRQSLDRSILLAQQESNLLSQQYQNLTNARDQSATNQLRMRQVDAQMAQRQQQINQYQVERDRVVVALQTLAQQANALLAQRQSLIAEYEKATGQLVKQDDSLRKFNDRLKKQEDTLKESPTGKSAATRAQDQKLKAISTYLPTDWEAVRQRLLVEYRAE